MRLFSILNGDDIFISYSRGDGTLYAVGLADKLTEKNFSCFIDRLGVRPGHDLPPDLVKKIQRCSAMVIVGTENAARSEFVQKEIAVFNKTRGTIFPINFDDNIGKAIWYDDIPGLASESEKDPDALEKGEPSQNVVNFIEKSFNYTRRNRRMAQTFWSTVAAFFLLITLGVGSYLFARAEADKALVEAVNARGERQKAEEQTLAARKEAADALEQARIFREEAAVESNRAKTESRRANSESKRAEQQTALADRKTEEAVKATKLAAEETKKAAAAEKFRDEADKKALEQETLARVSLAEKYHNIAEAVAKTDPTASLPWMQKAIETIPETDSKFDIYKLRFLHLAKNAPLLLINGRNPNLYYVDFSPGLDKVLTTSFMLYETGGKNELWDLKMKRPLAVPLDSVTRRPLRMSLSTTFSPDGKWIAAFSPETKPYGKNLCLYVWEAENAQNYMEKCDPRFDALNDTPAKLSNQFERPMLRFSSDSQLVMVNIPAPDKTQREVLIWNISGRKELAPIRNDLLLVEPTKENDESAKVEIAFSNYYHFDRRNPVILGKAPDTDLIITTRNLESGTAVAIRDIRTGAIHGKEFMLEKYVDIMYFTGDAAGVFTISHDPGKKKMWRLWNVKTNTAAAARTVEENFKILSTSRSGAKILLELSDPRSFILYDWTKNEKAPVNIDRKNVRVTGDFSDDEKLMVLEILSMEPSVELDNDLEFYDVEKSPQVKWLRSVKGLKGSLSISMAGNKFGLVTHGSISLHRLDPVEPYVDSLKIPLENGRSFKETAQPFGPNTLVFMDEAESPVDGSYKLRLNVWDKKNNLIRWRYEFKADYYPLLEEIGISANNKYVMVNPHDSNRFRFTVFGLDDGKIIREFPVDNWFTDARFDRTGTKFIAIHSEANKEGWKLSQWDVLSGIQEKNEIFHFGAAESQNWHQVDISRYGEYLLIQDSSSAKLAVVPAGEDLRSPRILEFSNGNYFDLAISILKRATDIRLEDDNRLVAVIGPTFSVEFTGTEIKNLSTGRKIWAPTGSVGDMKISSDGKFIAGSIGEGVRVWSTENKLPVTEKSEEKAAVQFFDFMPDSSNLMTISTNGEINVRFTGGLNKLRPEWMKDMGETLSGMSLNEDLDLVRIPQERLFKLRSDYLKKLQEAADRGDLEAKYLLENLKP